MGTSYGIRLSARSTVHGAVEGDPWASLAATVRSASSPWSCAAFGELYKLCLAEGARTLRSFRDLDDARRADLALDTLLAKRHEIAAADRPRAFFRTLLYRAAVSWKRSGRSLLAPCAEAAEGCADAVDAEEGRALLRLDARAALRTMNGRQRAMLVADGEGHSREEIAQAHGTTRANVDQVISRARRSATRCGMFAAR